MKTTGHLFVVFDALNIVKGIKTIGGSENQTYYIESKRFVPDRRLTPLIWQPYIHVTDPNGIIPEGDKVRELASSAWYINSIASENRITAKEGEATIDTPFAIDSNNALHVRKNTDTPIQVFFEAEYLDTRKDKTVHVSLSAMISSTSNSEERPAPKLSLGKPQSWKYSPFENNEKDEIEAVLSQDGTLYSSAIEWCKVEGDRVTPLADEEFYISGQNTNKLIVNPSLMPSTLLRARNLTKDTYNKYYGINPEWDNRMSEVMENRNFYSLKNAEIIKYYIRSGQLIKAIDNSACIYYKVDKAGAYTAKIKETVPIFRIGYSEENILTGSDNYTLKNVDMIDGVTSKTILIPVTAKYIVIQFSSASIDNVLKHFKLEAGDTDTPYTPAPEDLNWENLLLNTKYPINDSRQADYKLSKHLNIRTYYWIGYIKSNKDDVSVSFYINDDSGKNTVKTSALIRRVDQDYQLLKVPITIERFSALADSKFVNCRAYCVSDASARISVYNVMLLTSDVSINALFAPEDLAPNGIIKGEYSSDIKFTRYLPKLDTSIEFLTGDTLRAGMTTVRMKAVVKTNKELINNPEKYFDVKWYLEATSAGAKEEYLGSGEVIEVPVSKIDVKGGRFVPFRFDIKEKLL